MSSRLEDAHASIDALFRVDGHKLAEAAVELERARTVIAEQKARIEYLQRKLANERCRP